MNPYSVPKPRPASHRRTVSSTTGILVASTCTAGTVGPIVTQPRQKSKSRLAPAATKAAGRKKMFWRMKRNPELDRTGDWILANLAAIRGKAPMTPVPRGDSR